MRFFKSKAFFPILLIIISLVVCIQNYKFGTYLSGWDTLHPEFNFPEYFKRIFSVWQEHQGLGAVAAQAHASELFRVVIYYVFSFFLPLSFLRYSFFFLTLIAGPLGIYYFIKELRGSSFVAFVSGLFFLLNLTTLQQYTVPLEMFAVHFATIGWTFLFATKYINYHHQQKRNLWYFVFITILSSSMAHTPTLFYIFLICLSSYIFIYGILLKRIKKSLLLIALTIALNCYWLLPNIYFIANYGSSVANSKIHSQFSDQAFQVGKNFGDPPDTMIMKNFLFDWGEYNNKNGSFVYLLDVWSKHLSSFPVKIIGSLVYTLILFGFFISLIRRNKISLSLLPVFAISYFFIANDNFLFEQATLLFGKFLPTLKEALRFPFTKFSIILLFCYSFYFGYCLEYISEILKKFKKDFVVKFFLIIISLSLIFYMAPVFSGNLINSKMRVQIPTYYFDMFKWFDKQDSDGRIAMLPAHTFWGWTYYNWGYEGSGFLWFGLKQPILNREFDRWHPANENFYWELSLAVYREDYKLFESVLNKYQVKWLLVDFSITDASSAKSPYLAQFENFAAQSGKISKVKEFGTVKIYQVNNLTDSKDFIAIGEKLPKIGPIYQWSGLDIGFLNYGNYTSDLSPDVFYPFRTLFTNHTDQKMDFEVEETNDGFIFKKDIPGNLANYKLNVPADLENMVWYDSKNLANQGLFLPRIEFNGKNIIIKVPKVKGYFSQEINPLDKVKINEPKNCDFLRISIGDSRGLVKNTLTEDGLLRIESKLANNCSPNFTLSNLSHSLGYIITFQARNIKNKSLLFWLENTNLRRPDLEVYLSPTQKTANYYFIQPPMDPFGTGYTLHFDDWSFNKSDSINDLGKISIYPIPYNFLANLTLTKDIPPQAILKNVETSHSLPYLYTAKLIGNKQDTLILYQSFDPGWMAFGAGEHILINNWANGWKINSSGTIIIIFLPQLLEFFGFGILALTLIFLIFCAPHLDEWNTILQRIKKNLDSEIKT